MAAFASQEHRPIKRPRLSNVGPDVYPQDPKQKEDDLTPHKVKHGFTNQPLFSDEHGSARNAFFNLNTTKLGHHFNSILGKKTELNTYQDQAKRKIQANVKDNFWPVVAKSRHTLMAWMKDLAGDKPLTQLGKRVPIFNKKEEILTILFENNVPLIRACWFIKMTNVYNVAILDAAKARKKTTMDPFSDWTGTLSRYLREQLVKIIEHYQGSSTQTSFLTAGPTAVVDIDLVTRQWTHGTQLARYMYEEGLLDRHEFLNWMLDLLEKMKITDDTVLKLILGQVLKYTSDYVSSQLLSRKLAHFCGQKLAQFFFESSSSLNPQNSSSGIQGEQHNGASSSGSTPVQPAAGASASSSTPFAEYYSCPQHRSVVMSLSGILQTITIRCPGALVWHNLGLSKSNSVLCDSPLDLLPVAPSSLPMPPGLDNHQIRVQLIAAENQIIARSRAAEMRWSSDRCQQSTTVISHDAVLSGTVMSHMLDVLDALDRHVFERVEQQSSLDTLYHKVFGSRQAKDEEASVGDEPIVRLLCEWAVSTQRTGVHRAVVVARLFEKRQNEIASEKFASDNDMVDERDSVTSDLHAATSNMPFQNLLMDFLDNNAPELDVNPTVEKKTAFANLICLMCELICYDVFSHDAYMCTLISRGSLIQTPMSQSVTMATHHEIVDLASVKSEAMKQEDAKPDLDHQVLDTGFEIFGLKDEAKSSPDAPASVKSEQPMSAATPGQVPTPAQAHTPGMARTPGAPHTPGAARTPGAPLTPGAAHTPSMATTPGGGALTPGMAHTPSKAHTPISSGHMLPPSSSSPTKGSMRHLMYATHFPIPQDDPSSHECNQRMVVLFGVGKARDEARHVVKKVTKEIMKLYGKKNSIDTSSGDITKMKRKKEKETLDTTVGFGSVASLESTFAKFQKLSYYDQHAITASVSTSVVEMVNSFAAGSAIYLPQVEHISFLLDLMEYCYNINGLVDFVLLLSRELPEVEIQLQQKMSNLAGVYSTSVCLYLVAVLRKYHSYLLVCQEHTCAVFESLCKVVKHVTNPSDCTSAERVILAYRYELYTQCYFLRVKYAETWGPVVNKVINTLYPKIAPSTCNLTWDPEFMMIFLRDTKLKPEPHRIKELNDSAAHRYKFVCNAIREVCLANTAERVNDVSIVCANITASCNGLNADWLGVLKALCWSSNHNCGFIDVLTSFDSTDLSIHDNLAVFTAILVARHCFTLEDLLKHVALHSLLLACPSTGTGGDPDAEPGARLTCHLLLRLFQTSPTMPSASLGNCNSMVLKSSCDRHLLEAARNSLTVGAVVAVLKAIHMLGDNKSGGSNSRSLKKERSEDIITSMLSSLDDGMDIDMDLAMIGGTSKGKGCLESAGLSEYAKHCLKDICCQEWVREKFLKNPEELFDSEMLLDKMVSHRQAQQLVQMICYPGGLPSLMPFDEDDDEEEPEQQRHITRILQNMDMWSMRVSWIELQLMIKQATNSEMSVLLENIARGTIEVFQRQTESKHKMDSSSGQPSSSWMERENEGVWLMAPLISKLSSAVQGKVLKTAGQVLETGNNFWSAKNSKDREKYLQKSTSLLAHQPFLSLVFACLRGQDEQRECLLKSLQEQLEKFVSNAKEQQDRGLPTDDRLKSLMQEALHLRLSLVGGMFDTIQRNNNLVQEWATLLMQLVSHGVVDISNNSELFTIILDMLSVLIHGTLVSENSEKGEESRKAYTLYHSLIRKLKRELGEKHSASIDQVRQLLPLPKLYCEVLQCEPHSMAEGKNRGPEAEERRLGLQINNKQKVSPWDMIESQKNLAPLSLAWFGAVRCERKPLKYEDEHRLLLYHTHTVKKPNSYFLEAPPLPPEDLEPLPQEKPEEKAIVPILEPKTSDSGKTVKPTRRGRNKRASPRINTPTPSYNLQNPMVPMPAQFGRQEMYPPQATNTWYAGGQGQQQPGQYMTPQHLPPGGPRFTQPQTKVALKRFLDDRQPNHQAMAPGQGNYMGAPHGVRATGQPPGSDNMQLVIRARLNNMHRQPNATGMGRMNMNEGGMYNNSGPSMGGNISGPSQGFPMSGQSMNPGYGNFSQGMAPQQPGMVDSSTAPMAGPQQGGYNQNYPSSGSSMQRMPVSTLAQGGSYIGNQPGQQGQYPPTSRFTGMGGMSNMSGGGGMPQPNSMPMSNNMGGYNPAGGGGPQSGASNFSIQRQQQLQRQQMMSAMQNQPSQQVRPMYPQQMQRQMSGGGGMGQQGGAPGNFYQSSY